MRVMRERVLMRELWEKVGEKDEGVLVRIGGVLGRVEGMSVKELKICW